MSPRTKITIFSVFLLLLAIPAAYVALTWHVADPFTFRYLGRGEVEKSPFGNLSGIYDNASHAVPIFIEAQNTSSRPARLSALELRAARGRAPRSPFHIMWSGPPIPPQGTVRMQVLIDSIVAQRVTHEDFEVSYTAYSTVKSKALGIFYKLKRMAPSLLSSDTDPFTSAKDEFVAPLIIDPAHPE